MPILYTGKISIHVKHMLNTCLARVVLNICLICLDIFPVYINGGVTKIISWEDFLPYFDNNLCLHFVCFKRLAYTPTAYCYGSKSVTQPDGSWRRYPWDKIAC